MLTKTRAWFSDRGAAGGHRLRLSAAHDEWNHVGIALAAIEEGYFADEGLTDVELITFSEESVLLNREAAQVDLMARGLVDICIDPRTTFVLEACDRGEPSCIIAARRKNHAFVVIGEKGLSNVGELKGRTVCMSVPGGASDVMLRQVITDSGLVPDEDVPFDYLGGQMHDASHVVEEFRAGRYGPAILTSFKDSVASLISDGYPVLADLRKVYSSRHDRVTGANANFVAQHPELVRAFLKAMIRGCRFVLERKNAARFKEIMLDAGFLVSEREQRNFDDLFEGWQERVSLDLTLPRDGIDLIVNEEKRALRVGDTFRVEQVLRLDPHAAALAELGS